MIVNYKLYFKKEIFLILFKILLNSIYFIVNGFDFDIFFLLFDIIGR